MTAWHDVVARVRGLSTRLLGRERLEKLAGMRTLPSFVSALATTGYGEVADQTVVVPAAIDRATRRVAAERLAVITRWCGSRLKTLAPIYEDEDRRNLRALVRAVAAHVPPDQAVQGLLPTPDLPLSALEELARQPSLEAFAATLMAWGNPYGAAIASEAEQQTPSLFTLQLAMDREFARRACRSAGTTGEPLRAYVRTIIDAENIHTALACADGIVEHHATDLFIDGGAVVTREVFARVAASEPAEARDRLLPIVGGTVLAPLAARDGDGGDDAVLAAMLRELRRTSRLEPLSLNVVLYYILALRAELHDLARVIWGLSLEATPRAIRAGLVTP